MLSETSIHSNIDKECQPTPAPQAGTATLCIKNETQAIGMQLQHADVCHATGGSPNISKDQAKCDLESGSVPEQEDKASENVQGPNGIRFAILFTCIFLAAFSIGYVRVHLPRERPQS